MIEIVRQFFRQRIYFYVYIGEIPFKFGPFAQFFENFLGTTVVSEAFVFDIFFEFVVYLIGDDEFFDRGDGIVFLCIFVVIKLT